MGPREHETGQEKRLLRSQTDCVHGRWPLLLGDPIGLRSDELWREGVHRRWYSVPQPKAVCPRTEHVVKSRLRSNQAISLNLFCSYCAESPYRFCDCIANVTRYVFLRTGRSPNHIKQRGSVTSLLGVSHTFGPPHRIRFLVAPNPTNMPSI